MALGGEVMTETRTITFRCHCGRPPTFDNPAEPLCSECRQVCDECTCPQTLAGVDSDAAISKTTPTHTGALARPVVVPEGRYRCVVCGTSVGAQLVVAPACSEHGSPDAFETALAEAREERDKARRVIQKIADLHRSVVHPGNCYDHGLAVGRILISAGFGLLGDKTAALEGR